MNTIKIYLAESGRIADLHKDFPLYQGQFNDKLLNVYVPTSILAPQFDVQHYIGQISGAEAPTDEELDAFVLANTYPQRDTEQGDIIEFFNNTSNKFYLYTYDNSAWGSTEVDSFGTFTNVAGTSIKVGMIGVQRNGLIYESKSYFMRYLKTLTYQGVEYALYERKLPKEFTSLVGQGQNAPTIVINVVNVDAETNKVTSIVTSQTCQLDVMTSTMLDKDEPIEATDLENLEAQVNENSAKLLLKQNITDESLTTTQKTIVGAINELKTGVDANTTGVYNNSQDIVDIKAEQVIQNQDISANTQGIETNTTNISNLQSRVSNLEQQSGVEETYIGQMSGAIPPTSAQLNQFVLDNAHRAVQGGDVIIFIQTIPDATDKVFKYTYSIVTHSWSDYELPATEPASNTSKGIVQGSYSSGTTQKTQVNITNGEIEDIYIVDNSSNKRRLAEYLNTDNTTLTNTSAKAIQNEQDISTNSGKISALETSVGKIIDGTTTVGKATSATNDSLGNNISTTYLTNNAGVTKTQMKDYALPRVFNDVSFFTANGYNGAVPTDPNPIHTLTTSSVGDFEIFSAEKTISNATFQLANKNSYTDTIFASASLNCNVQFRLTTEIYVNNSWETANVELTDEINLTAGQVKKLSFASTLNSLEDVYTLADGNKIRQTLDVITETSQEIEFYIYSNETYPSTFYLNTTSETIILAQGKLGELPVYNIIGSGNSTKVVFTLPIDTRIDNNVEGLFILQYSGITTNITQLELSYNSQAIQIITPQNNGTNNPATVAMMYPKFAPNYDRWVFTGVFNVVSGTISVIADVDDVMGYLESYYTKLEINTFLNGKQDTLTQTQLNAVNSGIDSSKVTQIGLNTSNISTNSTNISTLQSTTASLQSQVSNHTTSITGLNSRLTTAESDITTIESKIPTQASSSNQLADKAFVNSTIQTATAHFRGNWATWADVPTSANSYPADSDGNKTPTENDYLVVQDASGYTGETLDGTWRFKYSGVWATDGKNGWLPEYQVNETPLTQAQLDALNSGATTTNIGQIATNTTNIGLNTTAIGNNTSAINGLDTRLGTAENNISAIPNNYVKYSASQSLTTEQKTQARTNIGAGTSSFSGSANDLTDKPVLDTTETSAQSTNASETISGTIKLHKVSKTGTASDLIGYSDLAQASSVTALASRVTDNETAISTINGKIPSAATSSNQLADKSFVNSSISTATATFRGTYNLVSDLSLTTSATENQIATAIASKLSALSITADNNDYCFVQIPTADATPTQIAQVQRFKYNGTAWSFEYALNNSGFTADQWAAINSGLSSADKTKLDGIESGAEVNDITDVQINGVSIVSSKIANFVTNTAYNASSNKIATMSDLPTDTNTWRPIKVNGTEKLTNSTSGNSLDLVAGTNITLSESSGAVTITATDTDTGATSVGLKTGDSGNVVTNMTYDSDTRKITFEKGITALTSHQSIKALDTTATTTQSTNASEDIVGSGKIVLHKVSKTGSYSDLLNQPTIPTSDSNLTNDRYVRYDTNAQGLNSTQQSNARTNIGAGTSNFDGAYSSLSGKPILGTAAALNTGTSQGDIPILGTNGKLASSVVPASAITDTFVVSSQAAMLALSSAEVGDVAVRTDIDKSFILKEEPYSTLANWQELLTPTAAVSSVNSQTGAVVLTSSDVGALPNSTKYGKSLSVSGTSVSLKDQDGTVLSTITTQDTDTGATSVGLKTGDTGNVVTNMTYDSGTRKITFEKGITALTSHQDISGKANTNADNINVANYQTALNNLTTPSLIDSVAHTQTGQATVVESYLSSDKKTWYRIWSDGWKECGGVYSRTNSDNPGPYDNITVTINLPTGFAFSNIDYQVQLTNQWGGSGGSYHVWSVSEHSSSHMSTTSFDAICMRVYLSGRAATIACYYYCCGY